MTICLTLLGLFVFGALTYAFTRPNCIRTEVQHCDVCDHSWMTSTGTILCDTWRPGKCDVLRGVGPLKT